jgi:hypothetical protein
MGYLIATITRGFNLPSYALGLLAISDCGELILLRVYDTPGLFFRRMGRHEQP